MVGLVSLDQWDAFARGALTGADDVGVAMRAQARRLRRQQYTRPAEAGFTGVVLFHASAALNAAPEA